MTAAILFVYIRDFFLFFALDILLDQNFRQLP